MAIKTNATFGAVCLAFLYSFRGVDGAEKNNKIEERMYGASYPLDGYEITFFGNNRPSVSPPFLDEPPQVYPTYLPSIYPPAPIDPIPTDDDTILLPPYSDQYLPPAPIPTSNNHIEVKILNMSCLDSQHSRFFHSTFKTIPTTGNLPAIDNAKENCIIGNGDTFGVNIPGDKMSQCGVRYCMNPQGVNLCLPLRIPTIRGLKLPEDSLITLQCKPQERTASQTKHLRLNSFNIQGRSVPSAIATGGLQRNFDTDISLYRRSPGSNDFSQMVAPGSNVQFGEDLLLKAAVKEGDGWKYSHMGMVIMQRISSTTPTTQSNNHDAIVMVDSQGCRVPTMKSICPEQPQQINPLVTTFPFRAFMFQGGRNGDEMVLSVKVTGCLQYEDCLQSKSCEEVQGRTRAKRNSRHKEKQENTTTDWQSYLEFRVVFPEKNHTADSFDKLFLFGGLTTMIFGIIFLSVYCHKGKKK